MAALSEQVAARVLQQVEFYFSDSNLPNDKFLLRCIKENDGFVSIAVICAFQKMRNHLSIQEEITPESMPKETVAAVAEVLRKSSSLKVSEDGTKVSRIAELSEEAREKLYARSVVASPFPWKVTKEEIESFFESHSKPHSVRLPRHRGAAVFSGYAIIEFSNAEEAQRVSALSHKFQGVDLKFQSRESFETYWATKAPYKGNDDYPKGLIVRFQLEKLAKKAEGETDAKEENKEAAEETISREDIKAVFEQYGVVKFVDFSRGATDGFVRFENSEGTDKARTAAVVSEEGGLVVKSSLATLEAVQGDDEAEYWSRVSEMQNKRKELSGGRGGKHGGKPFNKRQRRDRDSDGQASGKKAFKGKHRRLDDGDNEDLPEAKIQRTSS